MLAVPVWCRVRRPRHDVQCHPPSRRPAAAGRALDDAPPLAGGHRPRRRLPLALVPAAVHRRATRQPCNSLAAAHGNRFLAINARSGVVQDKNAQRHSHPAPPHGPWPAERVFAGSDPSLVVIDTQPVRVAAGVPKATTGLDANKRTPGRKRGLAVDVLGLIIGVVVLAASAHDNAARRPQLDQTAELCGNCLEKVLVDQGFKDEVVIPGSMLDTTGDVVRRNPTDQGKGFVPQPKRWVAEQVNCTWMLQRRRAREYDHRPDNAASRIHWASTANTARRLTTPAPAWRDHFVAAA
ncbi:transposase [Streptomyces sp. NPDC058301]|uniref:transposase n=1 Tax=Streptomyces sp. NPDC058301 TaxID=3346436 RepID=UPI0036E4DB61